MLKPNLSLRSLLLLTALTTPIIGASQTYAQTQTYNISTGSLNLDYLGSPLTDGPPGTGNTVDETTGTYYEPSFATNASGQEAYYNITPTNSDITNAGYNVYRQPTSDPADDYDGVAVLGSISITDNNTVLGLYDSGDANKDDNDEYDLIIKTNFTVESDSNTLILNGSLADGTDISNGRATQDGGDINIQVIGNLIDNASTGELSIFGVSAVDDDEQTAVQTYTASFTVNGNTDLETLSLTGGSSSGVPAVVDDPGTTEINEAADAIPWRGSDLTVTLGDDATIDTVNIGGTLNLTGGSSTDDATESAQDVNLTINANYASGNMTISAGAHRNAVNTSTSVSGASAYATFNGTVTSAGSLTLDNDSADSGLNNANARATFSGAGNINFSAITLNEGGADTAESAIIFNSRGNQTLAANVDGGGANEGKIYVQSSTNMTFNGTLGATNSLDEINVSSGSSADFTSSTTVNVNTMNINGSSSATFDTITNISELRIASAATVTLQDTGNIATINVLNNDSGKLDFSEEEQADLSVDELTGNGQYNIYWTNTDTNNDTTDITTISATTASRLAPSQINLIIDPNMSETNGTITRDSIDNILTNITLSADKQIEEDYFLHDVWLRSDDEGNTDLIITSAAVDSLVEPDSNLSHAGTALLDEAPEIGTLATVQNQFFEVGQTTEAVEEFFESLVSDTTASSQQANAISLKQSNQIANTRLSELRQAPFYGLSAGDEPQGIKVWTQAYGQTAEQKARKNVAGYDMDSYGVMFGADVQEALFDHGTLGVAFMYSGAEIEDKSVNRSQTDITSYQGSVYWDYDLGNYRYISGQFGYTYGQNDSTRNNVGTLSNLTAKGEYDSHTVFAGLELGGTEFIGSHLELTPRINALFSHYDALSYSETGAGEAGLNVNANAVDTFEIGANVALAYSWERPSGAILKPMASIGGRIDLIGDKFSATNQLIGGGSIYQIEGDDPARGTLDAAASLTYLSPEHWEFSATYESQMKSEFISHTGSVKAAYKF